MKVNFFLLSIGFSVFFHDFRVKKVPHLFGNLKLYVLKKKLICYIRNSIDSSAKKPLINKKMIELRLIVFIFKYSFMYSMNYVVILKIFRI